MLKNWKRFLDDFLDDFLRILNSNHPSIQFTAEVSDNSLSFLDILTINKKKNTYNCKALCVSRKHNKESNTKFG